MTMEQVSTAAGSAPSGRAGAPVVVLDALDYAQRVVLQGAAIPWEPAEHVRFLGQITALLRPDRTLIDLGRLAAVSLKARPALVEAMGARSRTGYALRTLLADEQIAGAAVETVRIAAASAARPIVLQVPSPAVWLTQATLAVGGDVSDIDADDRENASVYLADWLRRFAEVPVRAVILDARGGDAEALEDYAPLRGVAEHYRWELLLRGDDGVEALVGAAQEVSAAWWSDDSDAAIVADVVIARVPTDVVPEEVLARRVQLA